MDIHKLLQLLSDGEFHSGSALGQALDVSRTAIWKALPQVQALQVNLETIKGKGYRVPGGLDLLSENTISSMLPESVAKNIKFHYLPSCNSTNDYLMQGMHDDLDKGYQICLTELQFSGRGRRGKSWVSPFARNVTMSIGFSLAGGVESLQGLSLVVGIAVANVLNRLGVSDVAVKWPNDVLVGTKKIAGILIELQGEATTGWMIVCGVGLNVGMERCEGKGIEQDWVSLQELMQVDRNTVAVIMIEELIQVLELFKRQGFSLFEKKWAKLDYLFDKDVIVIPGEVQGKAKGIDLQGNLILDVAGQKVQVNAGEVSVRRL